MKMRDTEGFPRLFKAGVSASDRPSPFPASNRSAEDVAVREHCPVASANRLHLGNSSYVLLGEHQELHFTTLLDEFILNGHFPLTRDASLLA